MPTEAIGTRQTNVASTPLRDLGLTIAGTDLEPIIRAFEEELRQRGLTRLGPHFYLSTEWGVPFGTVSIAIPFYLARPDLTALHAERVGHVEGMGRADVLRYLRHEMGHVVNYAYRLYDQEEWVRYFGSITQPYEEEYRPQPFSRRYVRHLPGWYAQKHPDEDWAETFAVWLTPFSDWRTAYATWPTALAKLEYCDRTMAALKDRDPLVTKQDPDEDVNALTYSPEEYYRGLTVNGAELPPGLDGALLALFEKEEETAGPRQAASKLIRRLERELLADVYRWTGHFPERSRVLLRHLARRADELKQVVPAGREMETAVAFTTFVTALAMNYVHNGTYLP
jgi:hypothetical protein